MDLYTEVIPIEMTFAPFFFNVPTHN